MAYWRGLFVACWLSAGISAADSEPVSALWDAPSGATIEVDRAAALLDEIVDVLASRHVDGIPRADLLAAWDKAAEPLAPSIPKDVWFQAVPAPWQALWGRPADKPLTVELVPDPLSPRMRLEKLRRDAPEFALQFRRLIALFLDQTAGQPMLALEAEARVERQLAGNAYVGIGVTAHTSPEGYLEFPTVLPGGSAGKAGLQNEAMVLEIDDWTTQHQPLIEAIERIRGPVGTTVRLKVRDRKGDRELTIPRDFVNFQSVHQWHEMPAFSGDRQRLQAAARPALPDDVAYLRCSQLGGSTVHELRRADLQSHHQGHKGVVLDLRDAQRNSDIKYARLVADALLDDRVLWREQDRNGRVVDVRSDRECLFRDLPMVVLIAKESPAPQRVLAAVLQDSGRAKVIEVLRTDTEELPEKSDFAEPAVIYQRAAYSLAEGRWVLNVPVVRLLKADGDSRWSIKPDFDWHEPGSVRVAERRPRTVTVTATVIDSGPRSPPKPNPPVMESLGELGVVGLAIQELRAVLARRSGS